MMRPCYKRFALELYTSTTIWLSLKVHQLMTEAIATLVYGCMTWTLNAVCFDELRKARLEVLW